ncbi:MAG TPA: hypothetical protein VLT47_12325 [Anaeromyxobacteraceae bacterium]|nr:hypothetical protein [Anaeromyxobacteraceae bacterium]
MLTRIWAVLRSIFLLAIVGYAVWATPWMPLSAARPLAEQYDRVAYALSQTRTALWLAVAWIALEAVIGWLVVWRSSLAAKSELKRALKEAKAPASPQAGA